MYADIKRRYIGLQREFALSEQQSDEARIVMNKDYKNFQFYCHKDIHICNYGWTSGLTDKIANSAIQIN
jgi:hypothetical protein